METKRVNLVVEYDIPDIMTELAGGERKRGQWLTELVRDFAAGKYMLVSDHEEEMAGILERTIVYQEQSEARLRRLESSFNRIKDLFAAVQPQLPLDNEEA